MGHGNLVVDELIHPKGLRQRVPYRETARLNYEKNNGGAVIIQSWNKDEPQNKGKTILEVYSSIRISKIFEEDRLRI